MVFMVDVTSTKGVEKKHSTDDASIVVRLNSKLVHSPSQKTRRGLKPTSRNDASY